MPKILLLLSVPAPAFAPKHKVAGEQMRMVVTQASTVMLIFLPHFQMDLLSVVPVAIPLNLVPLQL